jgi:tetratricopeptide (TPR) repeat protein
MIGLAHWQAGMLVEAVQPYEQARNLLEKFLHEHPSDRDATRALGQVYCNIGLLRSDEADLHGALEWFAKARAQLEPLQKENPKDPNIRRGLRSAYWGQATALYRLQRYADAIERFDQALPLADPEKQDAILSERAIAVARLGRHAEAVAMATNLAGKENTEGETRFNLARVFAAASAVAGSDRALPEAERSRLAEAYASRAVALLDQALAKGDWKEATELKKIASDIDLAALRSREDFKKVEERIHPK